MSGVSELALLKAILPILPGNDQVIVGPGDDCAVLKWNEEYDLLVTVDQLIESVHYTPETSPEEAGAKLMKRNLSDIAAMGGEPLWAVVTLAAGSDEGQLAKFMAGAAREAARYGTALCGGDISALPARGVVTTLTLAGRVPRGQAILRSGARPGDLLYVTGEIGNSFLSGHHLSFTPRLAEGQALRGKARAMLDISDGLLLDARRMAQSSRADLEIDVSAVPLRAGASLPDALSDGEDYELLFCGPPGLPSTVIGRVLPGTGEVRTPGLTEIGKYGYEH